MKEALLPRCFLSQQRILAEETKLKEKRRYLKRILGVEDPKSFFAAARALSEWMTLSENPHHGSRNNPPEWDQPMVMVKTWTGEERGALQFLY